MTISMTTDVFSYFFLLREEILKLPPATIDS